SPHIGAVVALEKGSSGPLPPFLALNGNAGQGASFLGGAMEPMAPPSNPGGLTTIEHNYFGNQSQARFEQKFRLLDQLDASLRSAPFDLAMSKHAEFYGSAKKLMYDPAIAAAFRFSNDDNGRYGNTNLGRALIVARNAVQAKNGTVFLTVNHTGWDTHQNMF